MSVTCPSTKFQSGFTLLELLVVLALVVAIASITLPSLLNMQAAWVRRAAAEDLHNQMQSLGYRVRDSGEELLIGMAGANPPGMLQLPEGWQVSAQPAVRYLANGACLGGWLQVSHEDIKRTIRLEAPYCIPEELP